MLSRESGTDLGYYSLITAIDWLSVLCLIFSFSLCYLFYKIQIIIVPTPRDGSENDRKLIEWFDKYLLSICCVSSTAPSSRCAVVKETDSPVVLELRTERNRLKGNEATGLVSAWR